MQDLKVALIQSPLYWHEPSANMAMFEEKIWAIQEEVDLIILPEMFTTGFTMEAKAVAEPMNFTAFKWMKQMAAQTKAVITGSVVIKEKSSYYNRLIWMRPDSSYETYDKRHLFRMAGEHEYFDAGSKLLITELKGWRICPLICYDLRFPVWSRNTFLQDSDKMNYDLCIYVANWPAVRIGAWDTLLKARAIENLCYTIGLNRIGEDENGVVYNGHSAVIHPKGKPDAYLQNTEETVVHTIAAAPLTALRDKFPAYRDADDFSLYLS